MHIKKTDQHLLCFKNGHQVLEEKGTAIVCMSPGNSYFKEGIISKLLQKASELFSKVVILIPDHPATNTYLGLGHPVLKAQRLARLKGNNLKNHSKRVIAAILKNNSQAHLEIPDWKSEIDSNDVYLKYRKYIYDLYE